MESTLTAEMRAIQYRGSNKRVLTRPTQQRVDQKIQPYFIKSLEFRRCSLPVASGKGLIFVVPNSLDINLLFFYLLSVFIHA